METYKHIYAQTDSTKECLRAGKYKTKNTINIVGSGEIDVKTENKLKENHVFVEKTEQLSVS